MVALTRKAFKSSFTIVCAIVVTFMVGYWFYKFEYEDRDIGVVDYAMLEEEENIELPAVSLCFMYPFIEENLWALKLTGWKYHAFLSGEFFNEKYQQIDYANVTLDIKKYFLSSRGHFRNKNGIFYEKKRKFYPINHMESFSGFFGGNFLKCFTMRYEGKDHRKIESIYFTYNKTRLLADWFGSSEPNLYVIVHHLGQFLIENKMKSDIEHFVLDDQESVVVNFKDYEILKRRNSRNRKCLDVTNDYDKTILEEWVRRKGCRPPYLNGNYSLQRCDTKEKMIDSMIETNIRRTLGSPMACQRISRIKYKLKNYEYKSQFWFLEIHYPDEVKIISQSKEVDVHSLIGNIGGYLGLFLGKLSIN